MATIIEVQEGKIEHLAEFAEKVVKYGKQLLECIDEMGENEHYAERYGKGKKPYGFRKHDWDDERKEYPRYY
jgi:hypothetical protein